MLVRLFGKGAVCPRRIMSLYDTCGSSYNTTRAADERIVDALVGLLNLPEDAVVADIGAGSGNYSRALAARGYHIMAIEPSETMRRLAVPSPRVAWFTGSAERIPLADAATDGVICTLALHHFQDLYLALSEMARIAPLGPIVIFTCDPRASREIWIADYFPTVWSDAFRIFPPVRDLARLLEAASGRAVDIVPFRLPHDLKDNFAAAGWRTPERYLEKGYRENMSAFQVADPEAVTKGVARLASDLADGTWQSRYGKTLLWDEIDAGYFFLRVAPAR